MIFIRLPLIFASGAQMELRHLRYFVTLAEELHFTRAAERLNIAPPTLTVQIQEIERTLSARLFVRTKRSVALTAAGEIFLREARNVLETYARAESVGRRAGRGEIGRVEIGYVGSAAYAGVLQEQANRFRKAWTGVDVNAREFAMDRLPTLICDGHVDIGFIRLPMTLPRALRVHVLLRDFSALLSLPIILKRAVLARFGRTVLPKMHSSLRSRRLGPTRLLGELDSRLASYRRREACSPC